MTALRAVPDQAMDGAGLQERQLSQIEDDGFTRNQDFVDRILKVLDGCQIELPSKEKHTRRLEQDEEASSGHWRTSRPPALGREATGQACADGPDDVDFVVCA
jgi:hypothetical protein